MGRRLVLVGCATMALLAGGCHSETEHGYTTRNDSGDGGESATGGEGGGPGSAGAGGRAPDGTGAAAGAAGRDDTGPGPCSEIPTFADGLSPTRELFVSASGDDDDDGSEESPFATVERAAQDATPGTAIRILPGELAGGITLSELAGTADAPIWIGGVPGRARPIIRGGDTGLHLSRVRYVVVSNLEVVESDGNGINCDDGGEYDDPDATRYALFRNLRIRDIGGSGNQDCLKLSGVDDFWVLDSTFARCGGGQSGSGIDHVGCHSGLVARNAFLTMSGSSPPDTTYVEGGAK